MVETMPVNCPNAPPAPMRAVCCKVISGSRLVAGSCGRIGYLGRGIVPTHCSGQCHELLGGHRVGDEPEFDQHAWTGQVLEDFKTGTFQAPSLPPQAFRSKYGGCKNRPGVPSITFVARIGLLVHCFQFASGGGGVKVGAVQGFL